MYPPKRCYQDSHFSFRGLSLIWLIGCLSLGGFLLAKGLSPSGNSSDLAAQQLSATPVIASDSSPLYRNIEDIRVGQRVITPGTVAGESLPTAVDPLTWKKLTLRMENRWPDGTVDVTNVQTLQSPQWLAETHAAVGAMVPLPLDLKEMGEPQSSAEVMAIDACPAIEPGAGRVVLTTVNHLNAFLFDLTVNSERGPPQMIEVTGWHKLYSESRQWTSVCDLKVGEVLRGRDGPLTVQTLTPHPGTQTVFNMTVEDEHQYYVSALDLLAHNACRYVGSGEANVIDKTGMVPNTNAAGVPKTVYFTPDAALDSASAAKSAYNLPTTPTHVVDVDTSAITTDYTGFVEGGGTGLESTTTQTIPANSVTPLGP